MNAKKAIAITGPGVSLTPAQVAYLREVDAANKALKAAQDAGAFDPASPNYYNPVRAAITKG